MWTYLTKIGEHLWWRWLCPAQIHQNMLQWNPLPTPCVSECQLVKQRCIIQFVHQYRIKPCMAFVWCQNENQFFWNWINHNPIGQSVELLSPSHAISMYFTSQFSLSTEPWLWGCRGLPWTIRRSGHRTLSSVMTDAVNLLPLSLCRICGAPRSRNMSINWKATSAARLDVSGRRTQYLVKWSW